MAFNDDLFNMTIAHQIGLKSLENREVKRLIAFYRESRKEINSNLYSKWGRGDNAPVTKARMKLIRADINRKLQILSNKVTRRINKNVKEVAQYERVFQKELYGRIASKNLKIEGLSLNFNFNIAPIDQVLTSINNTPFDGALPQTWFQSFNRAQKVGLSRALTSSVIQGEGLGGLQSRVSAITRANTHQVAALSRTMLNHSANRTKEVFARENKIKKRRYTSVLDGRTTFICASLDGKVYKDDDNYPGIPQHMGCRSTYTFFFEEIDLASERITISDTRSQRKLRSYFSKQAKLNKTTPAIERRKWAKDAVGRISGKTTFQQFFSKQSASFQREYLGNQRYALYKKGNLGIDDMVNGVTGKRLSLSQLRIKDSKAFELAGL